MRTNNSADLISRIKTHAITRVAPTRRKHNRNQREDVAPDPASLRAQLQTLLNTDRMDICIGYWRTSSVHQTDAYGKDAQLQGIAVLAETHGAEPDIIIWDVDSGAEESRIGIDILKEAIATGQMGNIYCNEFGRLSRDEFLSAEINRLCKIHKTRIFSATENIPDGPAGVILKGMLQVFSIYERLVIRTRMSEAKEISIRRHGTYSGGNVPFGYSLRPTEKHSGDANLVIEPWEALVVELVFQIFCKGYSYCSIARWLNRQGIPTKYAAKRGWSDVQVGRMIESEPQYRAEALFGTRYESTLVAHEPILNHRTDPCDRTYAINTVQRLPNGVQVPANVEDSPVPQQKQLNAVSTMTYEQAAVLSKLFCLRDGGISQQKAADELNRLGLLTMRGRPWNQVSVSFCEERRQVAETRIREMNWRFHSTDDWTNVIVVAKAKEERNRRSEEAACRRIRQLKKEGFGLKKIAAIVNSEGHLTRYGNVWHGSTVDRALKPKKCNSKPCAA